MIFKYDLMGVVTMAEPKARYKKLVGTTFYFQTKGRKVGKKIKIVKFLLADMWVASSCVNRVVSDF